MTFLPIVERELRVAARRRGTWWIRMGAALVALVIGGWIMLIPGFRSPQTLGIALFVGLGIFTNLYCILAGLRSTSDCLSEEKREGTLGLLFLTDLKGYDIVLGKLAATSVNIVYGLFAVLPVMAIPILLGGVSIDEFWRVAASALNNLFFSLAAGMFCSAICRDEAKAIGATLGVIVFFTGVLPLLGVLEMEFSRSHGPPLPIFFIPSPGYASLLAFDDPFQAMTREKFNYFYLSLGCIHAMAWGMLVLAALVVPRSWQDRAIASAPAGVSTAADRDVRNRRARKRSQMLDVNPYGWVCGRDPVKGRIVWLVLALGGLLWAYGLANHPHDWMSTEAYITTAFFSYVIFTGWLATESSRRFALDRKSGAMELILSTPLGVGTIVRGQVIGLRAQYIGPLAVVYAAWILFALQDLDEAELLFFWICALFTFTADLAALACVGMWNGLSSAQITRSASRGVFQILLLPWILWAALLTLVGMAGFFGNFIGTLGDWFFHFVLISRVGIGLWIDAYCGIRAWNRLHAAFRNVVTEAPLKSRRWRWFSRAPGQGNSPQP